MNGLPHQQCFARPLETPPAARIKFDQQTEPNLAEIASPTLKTRISPLNNQPWISQRTEPTDLHTTYPAAAETPAKHQTVTNRRLNWKWSAVTLTLALLAAPPLRAGPGVAKVTFEEALTQYRATTRWPARVRIKATDTVQRIGGLGDVRGRYDILFWKEGDQIDATQTYHDLIATPQGGERAGPVIDTVRIVYDRQSRQYLHYQIYSPGGPRQHQEIAQFGTTEAGLNGAFWMLGEGRELSGYIAGDDNVHLADVMAGGTNRTIRTETLSHGGRPLIVLEADTPFGHHALWLDPDADDAPRRIEVMRTQKDRYEGERCRRGSFGSGS
jgi:hypothetical protein